MQLQSICQIGRPRAVRRLLSRHGGERRPITSSAARHQNIVYLGLGSNLGNRSQNISRALDALVAPSPLHPPVQLLDSSFIYQSEPMYRSDQPEFLNAACKISTAMSPHELLQVIKRIEADHGRQLENVPRNSPRPIDIDILLFNSDVIREDTLSIPHVGMAEREFVLTPLADIAKRVIHPLENRPISALLADLKRTIRTSVRKAELISGQGCRTLDLGAGTQLMSIVNCTPDSFSDGGRSYGLEEGIRNSLEHVRAGAEILDVGGMSTRPGAAEVPVAEEIARTAPLIEALRRQHGLDCPISIDTYRAATAEAAVKAGATIVNDVSAGRADPQMLSTIARLDVPYVMMHMRGNSRTMAKLSSYPDGVVRAVRRELGQSVEAALRAGVKRWHMIVDPGFGFAKDLQANCELLESLDQLGGGERTEEGAGSLAGFPILVGLSRKKFLGELLASGRGCSQDGRKVEKRGRPDLIPAPDQRLVPTIAASALAIARGARIIRAHDTTPIRQLIDSLDGARRFARR